MEGRKKWFKVNLLLLSLVISHWRNGSLDVLDENEWLECRGVNDEMRIIDALFSQTFGVSHVKHGLHRYPSNIIEEIISLEGMPINEGFRQTFVTFPLTSVIEGASSNVVTDFEDFDTLDLSPAVSPFPYLLVGFCLLQPLWESL